MRFSRLSLALYAAALLSGCHSLRRQTPQLSEPARIPPVREGEFASERTPRIDATKSDHEDDRDTQRGPVKSIGWPVLRKRDPAAQNPPTKAAKSENGNAPVTTVSGPLTTKLRRLFRESQTEECTDSCDGSPVFEHSSPGAISEPALAPRGPSSTRADYGTPTPPKRTVPLPDPESGGVPESPKRPATTRPRVPPAVAVPQPEPPAPPEVPPMIVPRPPERTQRNSNPAQTDNTRPPLPDLLVEEPSQAPQLPEVPDMPASPVPPPPVIPGVPAEPPKATSPTAPRSTQSAPKTKSTPRKSSSTPKNTEDDAVLEERLRQSAERMQSSGQRPPARTRSTNPAAPAVPDSAPAAEDGTSDPPLWPKRFGGSPPVGEPVVEPLPEEQPAATAPRPTPKPAPVKPAPAPAPLQEPTPVDPPAVPPAIPGLSPTIELEDEIPRPARPAPASPSTTSFRRRPGRSI